MNSDSLSKLKEARQQYKANRKFLQSLKKDKSLDQEFQELHNEIFLEYNCLACANCCKTTGPKWNHQDIERIARLYKQKPGQFIESYLYIDEENDYVLQKLPCPFLADDNYCLIYELRPKACREFPHTNARNMKTLLSITAENTIICPPVYDIVDRLLSKKVHKK